MKYLLRCIGNMWVVTMHSPHGTTINVQHEMVEIKLFTSNNLMPIYVANLFNFTIQITPSAELFNLSRLPKHLWFWLNEPFTQESQFKICRMYKHWCFLISYKDIHTHIWKRTAGFGYPGYNQNSNC